jgi:hypothetical protein
MIEKYGTITITEDEVIVSYFTFRDVDLQQGHLDACRWAQQRLDEVIRNNVAVRLREDR